MAAVTPESRTFDPADLLQVLDGRYADARLCSGGLVHACGIPDEVLGAPVGLSDAARTAD